MKKVTWAIALMSLHSLYVNGDPTLKERYAEADERIAQGDYDEAILILVDIARDHPGEMELVQKRFQIITRQRGTLVDAYDKLVDNLYRKKDYRQGYASIDTLSSVGKGLPGVKRLLEEATLFARGLERLAMVDNKSKQGIRALKKENWVEARDLFEEARLAGGEGKEIFRKYPDYQEEGVNASLGIKRAEAYLSLTSFEEALALYRELIQGGEAFQQERQDLLEGIQELGEIKKEWQALARFYEGDLAYTSPLASEYTREVMDLLERSTNRFYSVDLKQLEQGALGKLKELEVAWTLLSRENKEALDHLKPDGKGAVYPRRSAQALEKNIKDSEELRKRVEDYRVEYQLVLSKVSRSSALSRSIDRAEELRLDIEDGLGVFQVIQPEVDSQITQAEAFFGEFQLWLGRVEMNMANKNYGQSMEDLEIAQGFYVQALGLDEEVVDRQTMDDYLGNLQKQILQKENREVVLFVREMITRGKALYIQGLYNESQAVFVRARTRWFSTNAVPNKELNYWLNLLQSALSAEAGRYVKDIDPLYQEMTHYYNLANSNYEEGQSLISQGRRTEGVKALEKAEFYLQEVLIPMPKHQAGNVLRLKIQRLKSPSTFKRVFEETYQTALADVDKNPQEAYGKLRDLEEIEPNHRGLREALYRVELALGIRVPPPSRVNLQESRRLYQEALKIVNSNVRTQFPIALEQLERAIDLNPDNQDAIFLKDRIQLEGGGEQVTLLLSSEALITFREAEKKYIEGEYYASYALVQQLLADPDNASYPPLQRLQRRVESRL